MLLLLFYASSIFIFIIIVLWYIVLRPPRIWRSFDKLPGLRQYPIFGHAYKPNIILKHANLYKYMLEHTEDFREYGVARAWIFHRPYAIIYKAEYAEKIVSSSKLITKGSDYKYLDQWLGDGLLLSTGDKWKTRRKLLTPSFHFQILKEFVKVFNQQSLVFIEKIGNGCDKVDVFNELSLLALDIICETAMGRHVNAQSNKDSEYVKAVNDACYWIHIRQKIPLFHPNWIFNLIPMSKIIKKSLAILHSFTNNVIKSRKLELQNEFGNLENVNFKEFGKKKRKMAFLDTLLLSGAKLTEDEIREEVDTFMFEGHDTTSVNMSWVCYLLGKNIDVQEKLFEELDSIFGDSDRHANNDDLKKMVYLECIIKETLRLYPSVPYYGRHLTSDVQLGPYTIPKDVTAIIVLYVLHTDKDQFPDPFKFKPERFLEKEANRHSYSYLPFSAGPRNCIGQKFAMMELKVVLSWIFRKYKLICKQDVFPSGEIVLRASETIHIKFIKRK